MNQRATIRHLWLSICCLFLAAVSFAQRTVTGRVTDPSNSGVSGATVSVKGTTTATVTGANGDFSIAVPNNNATLVITSVGFEAQEIPVGSQTTVPVSLRTTAGSLNEVVVTGYSTQRKKDIIGAVSVINTEQLTSQPSANLAAQLQGRAAGVVVSSTGQPGSPAVVRIRGFQSFRNNDPLYIIDGVPTSDPSLLNPQDIESIQVLKDATSASIYGTRAANGVIIVTTRQGRAGRVQVIYEGYAGVQQITDKMKPELLNNAEYIQYLDRTTLFNADPTKNYKHPVFGPKGSFTIPERIIVSSAFKGGTSASDPRADPSKYSLVPGSVYQIYNTNAGTNWFDAITRNGMLQSHQVTATGGTDRANFSMGLNYFNQEGVFQYTNYKRYTVRANSSFKATNFLRVGENLQISYENRLGGDQRGEGGAWAQAYRMVPYIPVYDINGGWGGNAVGESGNGTNPLAQLYRSKDNANNFTKLFGNIYGEVQFARFLVGRSSIGMDMGSQFEQIISRRTYERAENQGNTQYTEQGWNYLNWTWTNTLTFQNTFAGRHDVKLLAGSEAISRRSRGVTAFGQNYDFEDPNFISIDTRIASSLGDVNLGNYNVGRSRIFSLFTRLDYAFNNKYLLNATIRRDGASVFSPSNRYGVFPSVGVGWRITGEEFMRGISWLSDLKLRAGWGQVGSISNVPALNQFTTLQSAPNRTNYDINGTNTSSAQGYRVNRLANPGTKWETTTTKNIGIDAAFLGGKWDLTVNVYQNDTKDLLVDRLRNGLEPVVDQPLVNLGTMRNKGIEVSVNNRGHIIGDLKYDLSVNFTHYKNELIKMNNEGAPRFQGLERLSNALITRAGDPVSSFYGYVVDGFYNSQADIDKGPVMPGATIGSWRFKDISGPDGKPDGQITSADQTILGSPHPDFQLGTNLGLTWKNFDFMAFFFWNKGNEIWNHTKYFTDMRVFVGGISKRVLTDSWTPQNMNAKLPRLGVGAENGYTSFLTSVPSSYFVEDGSYFRAKTIQLGFHLPKSLSTKAYISDLRFYIQAQNLFTITKYTGADPDVQLLQNGSGDLYIGVDRAGFPNPKQFLFGLNATF
jgi:TonB-linked SusC/RagA family outer membrane protein